MSEDCSVKKSDHSMGPIPRDPRADNDPHEDEVDGEVEMQMGLLGDGEHSSDDDSWSDEDIEEDPELDWLDTGYQLLPQDPENQHEVEDASSNHGASGVTFQGATNKQTSENHQPNLPAHLARVLPSQKPAPFHDEAFTQYTHSTESVERRKSPMATDDQIKAAMSNIVLPSASVPQWAQFVSEEDWKTQLVSNLNTDNKIMELKSKICAILILILYILKDFLKPTTHHATLKKDLSLKVECASETDILTLHRL
ncbi:uncharacterized protein [Ptychodera flava]